MVMLIEFLDTIKVDKAPFAENFRLNIDVKDRKLRCKVTYINNDGEKIPIDLVVYKWALNIQTMNPGISFNGKELNTGNDFSIVISYDVLKRQVKVTGTIGWSDISMELKSVKDFLEIPKAIASCC